MVRLTLNTALEIANIHIDGPEFYSHRQRTIALPRSHIDMASNGDENLQASLAPVHH
jgi:hypothetical protein